MMGADPNPTMDGSIGTGIAQRLFGRFTHVVVI
jgi:hypothetical protein